MLHRNAVTMITVTGDTFVVTATPSLSSWHLDNATQKYRDNDHCHRWHLRCHCNTVIVIVTPRQCYTEIPWQWSLSQVTPSLYCNTVIVIVTPRECYTEIPWQWSLSQVTPSLYCNTVIVIMTPRQCYTEIPWQWSLSQVTPSLSLQHRHRHHDT